MPMTTQDSRELAAGDPLASFEAVVVGLNGKEHLGRPFTFDLEFTTPGIEVPFDDVVGQPLTVRHERADGTTRYFNGVVSELTLLAAEEGVGSGAPGSAPTQTNRYHARIVPQLALLKHNSDCRIFQDMSVPEIVKDVLGQAGISEIDDQLTELYRTWSYCCQYRESDLDFIHRLLEHEGIYYFFEHEDGLHRIVLVDGAVGHGPVEGQETIQFDRAGGEGSGDTLAEWHGRRQVTSGGAEVVDFNFRVPRKPLSHTDAAPESEVSTMAHFDYPVEFVNDPGDKGADADEDAAGAAQAKIRGELNRVQRAVFQGAGDADGLFTGATFKVEGHPLDDHSGEFLIIGSTYRIANNAAQVASGGGGGGGGPPFVIRVTCIRADVPFRPARVTPKPIVPGPQTAIVSGPSDSELHVDEFGRVKVQFHWDRYGTADENSSGWIRVAKPIAGRGWGFASWPRIGQEVVVEFLEGDPDRPIVTGGVYNGTNNPPYKLPDEVTKSTYKSNSTPGGDGFNELRFEDKDGKEQIFIHGQRRMDVRVRGSYYETNYGNREQRVGWEKGGDVGGDLNTLVKQNHNFHLGENEFVLIDKNQTAIITEEHEHAIQKGSKNYVKELFTLYAEDMHFKGATSFSALTTKMTLEGSRGVHVLGGEVAIEAKGGPGTASMKAINIAHEASAGVKIKAPMIAVEGNVISLKSGSNEVNISPAGVVITGTLVRINSGPGAPAVVSASAKAADPAEDVPEFEPLEAIDAYAADDGKTGKKTGGRGGGGRSNSPRSLDHNDVLPYLPPPPPPGVPDGPEPPPVPPPENVSDQPCGIKDLVVFDTENGVPRNASDSGVLQLVGADGASTVETSATWFGVVSVSFKKQYGGTDKVGGTVTLVDEASGGPKLIAIVDGSGAPPAQGSAAWKAAGTDLAVPGNPNNDLWAGADASPTTHQVYGCGCDDVTRKVKVEVYPSQQYEAKIGISKLRALYNELNDFIEELFGMLSRNLPVTPIMEVQGPGANVTIGGTWGWKEEGDWKAAWNVGVDVALDPLFGLTLGIEASLIKCAALVIAIPPSFSDPVARYGADVFMSFTSGGKVAISGGPRGKWFTDGTSEISGEIKPSGEIKITVGIGGRVGSEKVLGAELRGGGSSGIGVEAAIDFGPNGLGITPKVEFLGLELAITLTTSVWDHEIGSNEFKFQAIDKKTLYPRSGDGRIQILPDN